VGQRATVMPGCYRYELRATSPLRLVDVWGFAPLAQTASSCDGESGNTLLRAWGNLSASRWNRWPSGRLLAELSANNRGSALPVFPSGCGSGILQNRGTFCPFVPLHQEIVSRCQRRLIRKSALVAVTALQHAPWTRFPSRRKRLWWIPRPAAIAAHASTCAPPSRSPFPEAISLLGATWEARMAKARFGHSLE